MTRCFVCDNILQRECWNWMQEPDIAQTWCAFMNYGWKYVISTNESLHEPREFTFLLGTSFRQFWQVCPVLRILRMVVRGRIEGFVSSAVSLCGAVLSVIHALRFWYSCEVVLRVYISCVESDRSIMKWVCVIFVNCVSKSSILSLLESKAIELLHLKWRTGNTETVPERKLNIQVWRCVCTSSKFVSAVKRRWEGSWVFIQIYNTVSTLRMI